MREMFFKGKKLDNDEWVCGFYVHVHDYKGNESHRIYTGYAETDCGEFYPDWFEVNPDTICADIGVRDKDGTLIFDNDTVKITLPLMHQDPIVGKSKVFYDHGSFCVNWGSCRRTRLDDFAHNVTFEVIEDNE